MAIVAAMVAAMVPMSGPNSGAISCHHWTTPEVLLLCFTLLCSAVVDRCQVTADPVISSQVSHSNDSPWPWGGHLVPATALKHQLPINLLPR